MRLDWIFLPRENPCAKFYILIIIIIITTTTTTHILRQSPSNRLLPHSNPRPLGIGSTIILYYGIKIKKKVIIMMMMMMMIIMLYLLVFVWVGNCTDKRVF